MNAAFWILSAMSLIGALLAISLRNLVHCVLSLILFFLGIAGHYFLLRADFLGAVQILIYIGAVAVLILFAIMLTRNVTGTEGPRELFGLGWWTGLGTALIVAAVVWVTVDSAPQAATRSPGQAVSSVEQIGKSLLNQWVVPLEVLGVLLTAALIGAVVIALEEVVRRR